MELLTNHSADFLKGALIGSVLGSLTGLLFAPKPGKKLRDEIVDGYHSVTEKGHEVAESIKETGKQAYDKINPNSNPSTDRETFLIGGAAGAVIGVVAALLLAPHSGKELREAFGEKFDHIKEKAEGFASDIKNKGSESMHEVGDKFGEWKEILKTVVEKLGSGKSKGHSAFEDIAEWANIGLRMIQQAGR